MAKITVKISGDPTLLSLLKDGVGLYHANNQATFESKAGDQVEIDWAVIGDPGAKYSISITADELCVRTDGYSNPAELRIPNHLYYGIGRAPFRLEEKDEDGNC